MTFRLAIVAASIGVFCLASAAAQPRPKAEMHTGEFTEPAFAERWGYGATDQEHHNIVTGETSLKHDGAGSIKLDTGSGLDTWLYFPNTKDRDLDATQGQAVRCWIK